MTTQQDSQRPGQFAQPGEGLTSQEMLLNMGPQHPSTHGVLRLVGCIADHDKFLRAVAATLYGDREHIGIRFGMFCLLG